MGRADVYSQPDAADPVLDHDVVLDLVRRHEPRALAVSAVDESGGEARAYLVDHDLVLKTQRPHRLRPRTSLAKEAYLLELLAPVLGRRVPRLLGYDHTATRQGPVEYVCMTRLPGRPVLNGGRAVLRELGALLRALHAAPVDLSCLPADTTAEALRRRLENGFGDIADSARDGGRFAEVIDRALAALPDRLTWEPVPLHANPGPTHVFADPGSGRFTGVIDFGDSYAGHPALDLHRWPDPADRIVLRDAYLGGDAAPPGFDRMWAIAMIYTDLAVVAAGSPHAASAAADLAARLDAL